MVSLPTVADVIGYEERHPETMDVVRTGYPRFVRHPFVTAAARRLAEESRLATRALFPVASVEAALRIIEKLGTEAGDAGIVPSEGWALLHLTPNDPEVAARAGKIIQHTGTGISSRLAEDWLVAHGCREEIFHEKTFEGDAETAVRTTLEPLLAPVAAPDILLCHSGMNAFYSAFEAVRAVQRPRGRTVWLQLGWLYTDTTETLRKCLPEGEFFHTIDNIFDRNAIEAFLDKEGERVAAVVTEAPTNPLLQTPDMKWLSALAACHGAMRILDPSTAGIVNVDLLRHADVLVTSLTKYVACEGDVMAGALAVNPASAHRDELLARARQTHSPAYGRDLARLALQSQEMHTVAGTVNNNARQLVKWLQGHRAVRRIHWACDTASAANYATVARNPECPGGVFSIELNMPLARFYDAFPMLKGPSFGTTFTLASPFIYMAHYDLVRTASARRHLLHCGIDPELLRISVGTEPFPQIQAAFANALG
jgi:cystathionine gamma-synthase